MDTVVIHRDQLEVGVLVVELNRPDQLNAFDASMRTEFRAALAECEADEQCRVVVIRGAGRAFSVGADISGGTVVKPNAAEDRKRILKNTIDTFFAAWDLSKPVIAQVHGYCLGISSVLCNMCDLVVVAEDTKIGWPGLPLGGGMISPTWAWYVNLHKAKELSYQAGSSLRGDQAAALGFANEAVPADRLNDRVNELARSIGRMPGDLLEIKKAALNGVFERQGFREAVQQGAMWDALAHTTAGAESAKALIGELGLKGALAHYADAGPRPAETSRTNGHR